MDLVFDGRGDSARGGGLRGGFLTDYDGTRWRALRPAARFRPLSLSLSPCCFPPPLASDSVRLENDALQAAVLPAMSMTEPTMSFGERHVSYSQSLPQRERRRAQRRAAIASEKSELTCASTRWHKVFEGLRRSEPRSAEAIAQLVSYLRAHEPFGGWTRRPLAGAEAMREQTRARATW